MEKNDIKSWKIFRAVITGSTWLSLEGLKELKRRDKLWTLPLILAAAAAFAGFVIYMLWSIYTGLYQLGAALQKPFLLFFYANLGCLLLLFSATLPLCMSLFFFSRDTKLLVSLPVKPLHIAIARLLELYAFALPLELFVMLPAIILYCVNGRGSLYFIFAAVVNLALAPLLPLCAATLLVFALVKLVNIFRHKILLEVAGMLFTLVAIFGFQLLVSRFILMQPQENLDLVAAMKSQVELITSIFAPVTWIAQSFIRQTFYMLPVAVLLYAAFTGFVLFLVERLYIPTYIARCDEVIIKHRKTTGAAVMRNSAPITGLVKKEFAVLFSNSTFIFEAAGELVILPLLLVIYRFAIPAEYLSLVLQTIAALKTLNLIVFIVLLAMSAINTIAATSLSREGTSLVISLTLPVPGRIQVLAKLLTQLILFLSAYWMNLVIVYILFNLQLPDLVYMIPGGAVFIVFTFILNIRFDLKKPRINWKHPMEAMKQNPNLIAGMGISMAGIAVLAGITVLLLFLGITPLLTGILLTVLITAATLVLLPGFFRFADAAYNGGIEI